MSIILHVPNPPSLNKLWSHVPGRRRVRSREYTAWLRVAGWEVKRQMVGVPRIDCRYNMELLVPISRRDSDNWMKPIGDLLQAVGVVTNDGNVHQIIVTPLARDDCAIYLVELPGMGAIRKPAKPRMARPSGRPPAKPTATRIATMARIRRTVMV